MKKKRLTVAEAKANQERAIKRTLHLGFVTKSEVTIVGKQELILIAHRLGYSKEECRAAYEDWDPEFPGTPC